MEEAFNCLKENIDSNDKVVIALSGGPDSMALTDLLLKLDKKSLF